MLVQAVKMVGLRLALTYSFLFLLSLSLRMTSWCEVNGQVYILKGQIWMLHSILLFCKTRLHYSC